MMGIILLYGYVDSEGFGLIESPVNFKLISLFHHLRRVQKMLQSCRKSVGKLGCDGHSSEVMIG